MMSFESPYALLIYGWTMGFAFGMAWHYAVLPLAPRIWDFWHGYRNH